MRFELVTCIHALSKGEGGRGGCVYTPPKQKLCLVMVISLNEYT